MYVELEGVFLNELVALVDDELTILLSIEGSIPDSVLMELEDDELTIEVTVEGWGVANDEKKNWAGWSKVGEASFVLDKTNDAGFRPMSWSGYIYQVKKLYRGQGLSYDVVVYGSNGVTLATPVSSPHPTYGFKEILSHGVKSKLSIGGDEKTHYFIDTVGALYRISGEQGMEYLGFEEFLDPLINPLLLYDTVLRRLYISSTEKGYAFQEDALTGGYIGISGLYRLAGAMTLVGPEDIEFNPIHIVTDIMDFKRRGMKHIEEIQFGVSSDVPLYAAIDYRYKKSDSFRTTKWVRVNNEGVAKAVCSAVEFRIRLKSKLPGEFDLSYIKVQHKYIDQRFTRDPREEPLSAY